MKPGDQVRDYILEQRIGTGGVGEVWRARHIRLNKPVAIKLILPHLVEDESIYSRFVQEAIATANLEHPHIISVHDFFSVGDDAFLVMSYIEGGSLQDRIRKRGRLSVSDTVPIACGILAALDFAHQKGIVHRDVKPSNILLSPESHVYLVDFGIALVLGKTRITRFGANIGTPDYMSPEQIRGEQLDHRTDVYSFGCVLYEMLTGRSPFRRSDDDTEFALMERHMNEPPVSVRSLASAVNEETEEVIMRALAKDREMRFAGCADMAKALVAAASAADGGPSPSPDKAARVTRAAAAALALTTLVSAGGWIASYGENERLRSAGPTVELDGLRARLDQSQASAKAAIDESRNELRDAIAAKEKAEKEALRLQQQLATSGPSDNAKVARLEKELQETAKAKDRIEQALRDLQERLAASKPSDKTTVANLQKDLQEARAAQEKSMKELIQLRQQLATAKQREPEPARKTPPIAAKPTKEIAKHLLLAKEQLERGAYDAALAQLNAANALDPGNSEIAGEIDKTRRACNAEKKLSGTDLKCY